MCGMYLNKVEICGVNTAKLKVLGDREQAELLRRVRQGDREAREQLIQGNLRLVLSVVQKFVNRGENLDDLFQVGCIGLIKAIDNFDPGQDVKFSTYGVPMIIGEIRRYLRDNNAIRVSRSMRDTAYKAMQTKERLTAELGKEPTVDQIAREMKLRKADVVLALEAIVEPISLYEPIYADSGDTIYVMDQLGTKPEEDGLLDELSIKEAINQLGEREKRILSLRFFAGKTQMEVAKEIHISQAQVSRLEKNALNRIKRQI